MVLPNPPDGVIDGSRHLYAVRVYYEDTDLSGITYHANYLRWFERARSDLLRRLEIDQRSAIEEGTGAYAVSELSLKYLSPAKLDDDVTIVTTCTQMRAASCRAPSPASMRSSAWRTRWRAAARSTSALPSDHRHPWWSTSRLPKVSRRRP